MINFVIFLASFISIGSASVLSKSGCPVMKPLENFNLTAVSSGVWHEIGRYPYAIETCLSCVSYDTRPHANGYIGESIYTPRSSAEFARADCRTPGNEITRGVMDCVLSSGSDLGNSFNLPLVQFVYDDNEYLVPYSCVYDEKKDIKQDFAWVFSRKQVSFQEAEENIFDIIKSIGYLDVNKFIWIDHSNCNADK